MSASEEKIHRKCLCFENRRQILTSAGLAFLTDYQGIVHGFLYFIYDVPLLPDAGEIAAFLYFDAFFKKDAAFSYFAAFSPVYILPGLPRARQIGQVKQSGKSYHQICKARVFF